MMFPFWFIIAMCGSLVLELQAEPISLGPMQVVGDIGNVSKKYEPLTDRDRRASHNAWLGAEDFHHFVKTGLGVIPPLDPFVEEMPTALKMDDHEIQGVIDLYEFALVGVKGYKVAGVEVRLDTDRLDFVLNIPLLKSDIDFRSLFRVDEHHHYFFGNVNVSLNNLVIKGVLTFTSLPPNTDTKHQKLSIVAAKYNLTTSEVQYNAHDIPWNPTSARTRRSLQGSRVVKVIAEKIAKKTAHGNALSIIKLLNTALSHYTTAQVLAWLLRDGN